MIDHDEKDWRECVEWYDPTKDRTAESLEGLKKANRRYGEKVAREQEEYFFRILTSEPSPADLDAIERFKKFQDTPGEPLFDVEKAMQFRQEWIDAFELCRRSFYVRRPATFALVFTGLFLAVFLLWLWIVR